MSTKEALLHELEDVPEPVLNEVLDFARFLRAKLRAEGGREAAAPRPAGKRRQWRELKGLLPFPICGEDAQAWVSRSRRESDERRVLSRGQP
jgi:hypothetical protein